MNVSPQPIKARYVGYAKGTENHGDEALFSLIRDRLAPEIEVSAAAGDCDLALLGGGTLINQSPWLIEEFQGALDRAGRGAVFGTGVGDPAFWGDHFDRWRPLLERCEHVGVRGPRSLDLLRQNGFERAVCIGDPYLSLRAPDVDKFTPRRIGINLGATNDSHWGGTDREFLDFMAGALGQLKEQGWSFVWVCVWSKDLSALEDVRRRVDGGAGPILDARSQNQETLRAIGGCEIFLGEKLHANAMAAIAGVPFISLEYQPKVRDFAESLDMGPWVASTAERSHEAIVELVESLRGARHAEQEKLIAAREAFRRKQADFVRTLKPDAA